MSSRRGDSPQAGDALFSRRRFLGTSGAAGGGSVVAGLFSGSGARAADGEGISVTSPVAKRAQAESESLVTALFTSLSREQMEAVVFPFGHPERSRVENNWHITRQTVGGFFTTDQQAMIREIFDGLHSEPYREAVRQQFIHDNSRRRGTTPDEAFGSASIALFGAPGTGQFELVFTGRHCTRRCDGDSVEGAAFGGPIFYGHQAGDDFDEAPDHPGNAYWFQAQRANDLFAALDGRQREQALCDKPRRERGTRTVALQGAGGEFEGLPVADLSADQKAELRNVLEALLAPFRDRDRQESMKFLEPQFEQLHLAYYKAHDVGGDGIWDTWQIEGPSAVWHFRGDPHVHTWVHLREPAASDGGARA